MYSMRWVVTLLSLNTLCISVVSAVVDTPPLQLTPNFNPVQTTIPASGTRQAAFPTLADNSRRVIDTGSTSGGSITQEAIEGIPTGRNFESFLNLAPGVTGQDSKSKVGIRGDFNNTNVYLIDGVQVNQNIRGQELPLFIEDAIQETTTAVSGVSAEYGAFAGGVINVVTKSGGNKFSGSLYFENYWRSDSTRGPDSSTFEGGFTAGGPLARDRLWYFTAARKAEGVSITNNTVANTYTISLGRRLTDSLRPGQTVTIDLNQPGFNFFTTPDPLTKRHDPGEIKSGNYTGILTPNFFIDAQYAQNEFAFQSGQTGTFFVQPDFIDLSGFDYWSAPTIRSDGLYKGNYFLSTGAAGAHDIAFGYDTFSDIQNENNLSFRHLIKGPWGRRLQANIPADGQTSIFVNDKWQLNDNWSFNLGYRYEDIQGVTSPKNFTWESINPRISVSYAVDSKNLLKSSVPPVYQNGFDNALPGDHFVVNTGGLDISGLLGRAPDGSINFIDPEVYFSTNAFTGGHCPDYSRINWGDAFGNKPWTKAGKSFFGAFPVGDGCGLHLGIEYDFDIYKQFSVDTDYQNLINNFVDPKPILEFNQIIPGITEWTLGAHVAAPTPQPNKIPNDVYFHGRGSVKKDIDDQWGLKQIGFRASGRDGKGLLWPKRAMPVIVAVVDSGVDVGHPDLQRQLWANFKEIPNNNKDDDNNGLVDDIIGWNFVNWSNDVRDQHGHGTFVSGIIGAAADNAIGIAGVNPWARIMPVKVANFAGDSNNIRIAMGISYAARMGARVINVSLSGKGESKAIKAAVGDAVKRGALVVVAAGNEGMDAKDIFPGNTTGVITVAAINAAGKREKYSNWGAPVDIAAPGADILSLRAAGTDIVQWENKDYKPGRDIVGKIMYRASGTSFAAPYVAGVASLLWSINPKLSAAQIKRMVLQSAKDTDLPGIDQFTGYGLLDAAAALKADPEFFVEARIRSVKVAQTDHGPVLQLHGDADADQFARAWIEIGPGEAPSEWKRVSKPLTQSVADGILGEIPTSEFKDAKQWILKIVAEHKNGKKRENRFILKVG